MNQSEIQSFIDGFTIALQQTLPQARVTALQALAEKGLRLGIALDQPDAAGKSIDITGAALDFAAQVIDVAQMGAVMGGVDKHWKDC